MDAKSQSEQVEVRRKHLLRIIRAAQVPMSTNELWETCPAETVVYELCPFRHDPWMRERATEHTHATVTVALEPSPTNVYSNLRQLEGRGLIERVRFESNRSVYWRAVLSAEELAKVNREIEQLEAMFGVEYRGPNR